MRYIISALSGLFFTLSVNLATLQAVENTWDYSVQVSSAVQASPARITLTWPQDTNGVPSSYTIYRKTPGATSWGSGTQLAGSATSYTDTNVSSGAAYEYRIVKVAGSYTGYGYIHTGINAPLVDNRGKVVLIVDNTFTTSLASELARLEQDLAGDGWTVIRHDVSRTASVASVKGLIKAAYDADRANVKSVFLFGQIPVPYSGQLNPDGHPDHVGAWPADVYYGDMDGTWTDSTVNYTQTLNTNKVDAARMSNVPGDGKFDQTTLPSAVELEVGRVDLSKMPGRLTWGGAATFPSETELLRKYLNKAHNFRHRKTNPPRRAILGDYFGVRGGEAFAASGFRSFAPLVGASNIRNLNVEFNDRKGVWIPQVAANDYLLTYGAGAGSYATIGGLGSTGIYNDGSTTEMVGNNVRGVFNLLFGSWLGDWDSEDNILRAPLATDYGLISAWSGRPHWFLHPLGQGETFGHVARLAQNNTNHYQTQINSSANRIHIALMGDPTLRLHAVVPVSNLGGTSTGSSASLAWSASTDSAIAGYHVYRRTTASGAFTRLTSAPVTTTNFTDNASSSGATYMVRAIKLENTPSGSYYNASQGIIWTVGGAPSTSEPPVATTPPPTEESQTPSEPTSPSVDAGTVVWFDDALPSGAGGSTNGDTWNWISSNPTPYSGTKAHKSDLKAGLHEHSFNWAIPLTVNAGEVLFTYVYLDPVNPPSQIMLSWASANWEHRAYWGSNLIGYGVDKTASRYYMGPLPEAGKWVRLEVPASAVALEGASIVGMGFSLYDGAATWDYSGKSLPAAPDLVVTPAPDSSPTPSTSTPQITDNDRIWFDDALPRGAGGGASGGDAWKWVNSNPAPFSGTVGHQSSLNKGLHEHFFNWASDKLTVATGERLFTYVHIDPANPPRTIMLSWMSNNWEHRAYWGEDKINYGKKGTPGRYYAGPIPATGRWVRLEVPASAVDLEGHSISGMAFSLYDGRVTWDATGKVVAGSGTTSPEPTTPPATTRPEVVWFDDALPAGAGANAGGEGWNWVSSNPAPYSGTRAHQSANAAGLHEHSFAWAFATLDVAAGDTLFTYVYLDPANPPSQIMLSFGSDNWEHRAYWGANKISYGKDGTASRRYMGALPPTGQWVRLEVPASAVNLEGHKVTMMGFSTYDGRVTWDKTGLNGAAKAGEIVADGGTSSPTEPVVNDPVVNDPVVNDPVVNDPIVTDPIVTDPSTTPGTALAENSAIRMPSVGDNSLTVLTPTMLELRRVTAKQPDPATLTEWNFVTNGTFNAPANSQFAVTVNGQAVGVKQVGFRRRALYAPIDVRDLRVDNALYLELNGTIAEGATVEVRNPGGTLWPSDMEFKSKAEPLRFNPAIHVNQEGYVPSFPKKAMVGYYLGSLGELDVNAALGFKIVTASTGVTVHSGTLTPRRETGYIYAPLPYQKVYEADFSSFTTPGEYQLVVPGLGASLPFLINEGVAMAFTRTYALGLYHQRCGVANSLPYTRHTHDACHTLAAEIPSPQSSYAFTWTTIASKNSDAKSDPRHTAPQLKDEASQLYPFVNKGKVDVTLGHHDAGDYSKYTINVAQLVHTLTFTADSIAGAAALDNLGLPESGDGVSDILQAARHEADYLAKLQDADGGFYFIVYPKTRAYESNVTPDKGDQQVVWPKNTSATAASIAALAQIASSPAFKAQYPTQAAAYLNKAKLGWQFLTNAIAKHGKDGSYQKVTFYGNNYLHDDELAWAAAQMFLATGETQYHQKLLEWFPNPADTATMRWGWWRMSESWGNALRSYAFGARSGRIAASQLNAAWLAKAEEQINLAAEDALKWSNQSAYGTAFPEATRHVMAAGWYFSLDQASDMAVAYQLNPRPEYITALVGNMNYEAGTNPVNMVYLTGLGLKRQRETVNQYAKNDRRVLPPAGIPIGNVQDSPQSLWYYPGAELRNLAFPSDAKGGAMYPFYDRWTDTWNVMTEFITVNQARGLLSSAMLAARTSARSGAWKPATTVNINVPSGVAEIGIPVTLTFDAAGLNLAGARVTWEARDQQPDFGATYTITPTNAGPQWVEVEITWPDGRRLVGTSSFEANASVIIWVDDAVPAGATTSAVNDAWNWISGNPTPKSGTRAHQTAAGSGLREHAFNYASAPLVVGPGDTLFAWVYLDPAAMPETIMLHWNDGSWEHRAFWGADRINYGTLNTASRRSMGALPAGGGWVKLEVPAAAVGLEGSNVIGMCFSTYGGGKVTWDAAGRSAPVQ